MRRPQRAFGELMESIMDVSSSMMALGARQLGTVLDGAVPRQALGTALRLLQHSAGVMRAALPGEGGLAWRELENKLEAFQLFQQAEPLLGLSPGDGVPLAERLGRARALGAYRSVWASEGLGHAHAESAWAGGRPRQLLSNVRLDILPRRAVLPLHTGAGLSFAGRLLDAGGDRHRRDLESWIALWEENARPGWREVAVEALGLVARNLHPQRLPRLDALLGEIDPVLPDYLWHGAGRGLYFAPTHALPWTGAAGRALEKAGSEPPHEPGRLNATAGLAWAMALVNVLHPEVLEDVVRRHDWDIGSMDAFANGVASALLVWRATAEDDAQLAAFVSYRPQASGSGRADRWDDLVRAPAEAALRCTGQPLRGDDGAARLFRYQPAPAWGSRP